MNDDEIRESLKKIGDELASVKGMMNRSEDRSLGYFIAAFGLSMIAISIGLASMPNATPDEDDLNFMFRVGMALTFVGLLGAFTRFFSVDPNAQTLFWIDKHKPFVHLRKRKK